MVHQNRTGSALTDGRTALWLAACFGHPWQGPGPTRTTNWRPTTRNNYLAWKQHAQDQEARADHLEQQVGRLQAVLGQWQDEAATADANAGVALKAFKEVTGKSVREHLGDEETDRRLAEEKSDSRRNYGLK